MGVNNGWANVLAKGTNVMVYTLTHYILGEVKDFDLGTVTITKASWVADQGRMNESLTGGAEKLNEVEPMPDDVVMNLDAVVMMTPWRHALPKRVK